MQSKLTLRIDEKLIKKAKIWSNRRNISISQVVGNFFSQLSDEDNQEEPLSEWVKKLSGVSTKQMSDNEIREKYIDHLEDKHQ